MRDKRVNSEETAKSRFEYSGYDSHHRGSALRCKNSMAEKVLTRVHSEFIEKDRTTGTFLFLGEMGCLRSTYRRKQAVPLDTMRKSE